MNIIQYDPWRRLQQEMGNLFDPRLNADDDSASMATSDWVPAVDINLDSAVDRLEVVLTC